jgi:hypothetical protein
MKPKKKTETRFAKRTAKTIVLLTGVLFVGIAIGVGAKLAFDYLTKTDKTAEVKTPTQNKKEEGVVQDAEPLPENFPRDFPVYPESILNTSWTTQGELKEGISVLWESEDSPQEVADFYKGRLPELGWSIGSSFEKGGSYTLSFEKETYDGFVGITRGEEGLTQISVTLGVEIIGI